MFLAKAAALRALDLSRQVGAAIFTQAGEVVSLGSNEVPKAGGGTYWAQDPHDDRDYKRGIDSNLQRKREILGELLGLITPEKKLEEALADQESKNVQFMDALEYGRINHAEMSALMDAARVGCGVEGGILYCTTFPQHVRKAHSSSGLSKVVFLEPVPGNSGSRSALGFDNG